MGRTEPETLHTHSLVISSPTHTRPEHHEGGCAVRGDVCWLHQRLVLFVWSKRGDNGDSAKETRGRYVRVVWGGRHLCLLQLFRAAAALRPRLVHHEVRQQVLQPLREQDGNFH